MDSRLAFANGEMYRNKESMVFDWEKAAELIKEHQPKLARAGLRDDWEYTGGSIWKDGSPVDEESTYVFLASTWAVPEIELDGEVQECYKMENEVPEWGAETFWPEEARKIIDGD